MYLAAAYYIRLKKKQFFQSFQIQQMYKHLK